MRDDVQRIQDIQTAAEAILDYVSGMTAEEALLGTGQPIFW